MQALISSGGGFWDVSLPDPSTSWGPEGCHAPSPSTCGSWQGLSLSHQCDWRRQKKEEIVMRNDQERESGFPKTCDSCFQSCHKARTRSLCTNHSQLHLSVSFSCIDPGGFESSVKSVLFCQLIQPQRSCHFQHSPAHTGILNIAASRVWGFEIHLDYLAEAKGCPECEGTGQRSHSPAQTGTGFVPGVTAEVKATLAPSRTELAKPRVK